VEESRTGGVIAGVIGFALMAASCLFMFAAERGIGRKNLPDAAWANEVQASPVDVVDGRLERKLVHVAGRATTDETVTDPKFGVSVQAIRLERVVSMYQWRQTSRKSGKTTKYRYDCIWSGMLIDSSRFRQRAGHENPRAFPVDSARFCARSVTLGAHRLTDYLVAEMPSEPLRLDESALRNVGSDLPGRPTWFDGGFFIGTAPDKPRVGDLRVVYRVVRPGDVTILARQIGTTFGPFPGPDGAILCKLRPGLVSAADMFEQARRDRDEGLLLIRAGVLPFLWAGVCLLLYAVVTAQGGSFGCGTAVLALLLAAALLAVIGAIVHLL